MPIISTRQDLKQYALRKLGSPVIQIDVADEQIEDRLDEAIEKFQLYHYDGYSEITLILTLESGKQSYVLPSNIISVDDMYQGVLTYYHLATQGQQAKNELLFNRYTALFRSYDPDGQILTPYYISDQWLSQFRHLVVPEMNYDFNRATHTLTFIDSISADSNVYFRANAFMHEADNSSIYNHDWLKKYFIALLGIQWGDNVSKFTGVPMPNGSILNSQGILDKYTREKEELETEISAGGQPVGFWMA